jgi:ABC-2 type transport system ATP-binding protein
MGAAIEISGLTKSYGSREVLHGIDLSVEEGTCIALLGPNGAGKTVTVEILESYRSRDAGAVQVLGVDPARPTTAWRERIGIVLQSSTDNGDLTPSEVLHAFAVLYPKARAVDEVLELVGLTEQAGQRARNLSGGQRRRLDVGLGIVGRPEVLFLDEPTTGFDAEARQQFWAMIKGLRSEGTTIVLTTHYLDEAEELADMVAVIASGAIRAVGPPQTIGGRDEASATVRFKLPTGAWWSQETDTPSALVASLVAEHGELSDLTVTRPSLEDIYLAMVREEHPSEPELS